MTKTLWIAAFAAVFIWSAIDPKDRFTWFLEVVPAIIAAIALAATYQRFRFTPLAYGLILFHAFILMIGGHYTYAEVPLFDQLSELFNGSRNNYDKLGHLTQGFVPAIVAREIIIRNRIITGPRWQHFFVVCFCLALSALYELIEWWVALATGTGAEAFLGTQGYVWDTQSDMGYALLGAVLGLVLLGRVHDREIGALGEG